MKNPHRFLCGKSEEIFFRVDFLVSARFPPIYTVWCALSARAGCAGGRGKSTGENGSCPPVGAQIENFSHGTSASLPSCGAIEGHARARRSSLKRRNCSPGVVVVAHSGRVSDSAREHCQVKAKSGDPAPAPFTRHARLWNEAPTVARTIGRRRQVSCTRNAAIWGSAGCCTPGLALAREAPRRWAVFQHSKWPPRLRARCAEEPPRNSGDIRR